MAAFWLSFGGKTQAQTAPLNNLLSPITQPLGEGLSTIVSGIAPITSPVLVPVSSALNQVLSPVTESLAPLTQPLTGTLNVVLDPITNPIDQTLGADLLGVLAPVLSAANPLLEPLLPTLDQQLAHLSQGNLTDALLNLDIHNTIDGNGLINDLLGTLPTNNPRVADLVNPLLEPILPVFEGGLLSTVIPFMPDAQGLEETTFLAGETNEMELFVMGQPIKPRQTFQLNAVNFQTNSAQLTPAAQQLLSQFAVTLQRLPQSKQLLITGHTDDRGSASENQRLSEARARAVADFLISQGVSASRLTALGQGQSLPLINSTTDAARLVNRRVEFKFL
jgi:outer membrane protein OmpA-like peptidoglycan-associated protein